MPFLAELTAATATVRRLAADVEPSCYTGPDAVRVLGVLTEAERVIAALRTLFARRVEESNVWRHEGDRSAAHFLAHRTGTTVGQAIATLEVAHRLEALPATDEAFRNGELSEVQAAAVSEAAEADPAAEQALLAKAAQGTVKALRDECRRIKAAACPDELARYKTIRQDRHLMIWADTPFFCEHTNQAAANQDVSGRRERWKMVPAVTEVRRRHPLHSHSPSPVRQARSPPQAGHTKPSGQRSRAR